MNDVTIKRNQKISDEFANQNFKIKLNELIMIKMSLSVDTCRCYHFGSRRSLKSKLTIYP